MQSTLRIRLAAALLASGAALLAGPALADHRYVTVEPLGVVRDGDGLRDQRWRRDERAPRITELTPQPGDEARGRRRTTISARLDDNRSGIDPASVRLRVNGHDVTHAAYVSADEVRYRDRLRPGAYVAEVTVRDRAGNTARRSWRFEVREWRDHYGYERGWGQRRG